MEEIFPRWEQDFGRSPAHIVERSLIVWHARRVLNEFEQVAFAKISQLQDSFFVSRATAQAAVLLEKMKELRLVHSGLERDCPHRELGRLSRSIRQLQGLLGRPESGASVETEKRCVEAKIYLDDVLVATCAK